jgi:hypothetical protein
MSSEQDHGLALVNMLDDLGSKYGIYAAMKVAAENLEIGEYNQQLCATIRDPLKIEMDAASRDVAAERDGCPNSWNKT